MTLATLLGGGGGSSAGGVSWPSAAGGEDEELPDKTPGVGDCAGRPTTASVGDTVAAPQSKRARRNRRNNANKAREKGKEVATGSQGSV